MRVGLNAAIPRTETLASVASIMANLREILAERHQLVPFPDDYYAGVASQRRKTAEELVRACDVIVSPPDATLQVVRAGANSPVPLCLLMHGSLPRGAQSLQPTVNTLRGSDVLVVNNRADVAIARTLFQNATVRLMPFGYREQTFHPPTPEETAAMRLRLGIPARAPMVVYAGRGTIEKNIHTVVKVFSAVRAAVPEAHLVLAGALDNVRFGEFGVFPLQLGSTLERMVSRLGLAASVRHPGPLTANEMRAVYGAADVVLNLTLHHDENFGLAQVEAMACGTPVVGTHWGGLQDTIVHGETGFHVSTMVTDNGVKSSWWEAANRVVQLLRDPELRAKLGRRGTEIANERFSHARVGEQLGTLLEDALYARRKVREVLRPSDFAQELWEAYRPNPDRLAPGRQGPAAFALYRRLITPYTGLTDGGVAPDQPASAEQVVFLAHPVEWNADGTLAVNDAQFPCDVQVPAKMADAVRAAFDALQEEPVTTVGSLLGRMEGAGSAHEALAWMLAGGLVLRASPKLDAMDPALARETAITPLVTIRRVDHPVDIVYVA